MKENVLLDQNIVHVDHGGLDATIEGDTEKKVYLPCRKRGEPVSQNPSCREILDVDIRFSVLNTERG